MIYYFVICFTLIFSRPGYSHGIRIIGYDDSIEIPKSEIERVKFESALLQNLEIREYGKFDFAAPLNGRNMRLCGILVPRDIEVLLRILSSPILQSSPLSMLSTVHSTIFRHLSFFRNLVKLEPNGEVYRTISDVLRNDVVKIQRAKNIHKPTKTWQTYFDNVAAYTYLWQHVRNVFTVHISKTKNTVAEDVKKRKWLYYRDHDGQLLRYKYRIALDVQKCRNVAALLSHWGMDKIPLSDTFIRGLESELNEVDRSEYPKELFQVSDTNVDLEDLPIQEDRILKDAAIFKESERVASATIKFMHLFLAKMLELHGIPVFKILRNKIIFYRVHPSSKFLSGFREFINNGKIDILSKSDYHVTNATVDDSLQVEELLFESVTKFNPYWSLRNDSLYSKSIDWHLNDIADSDISMLYFEPDQFYRRLINIRNKDIDFEEIREILHRLTLEFTPRRSWVFFDASPGKSKIVSTTVDIVMEQYKALSSDIRSILIAKSKCLLGFLYLFGVTDKTGRPRFPHGWPRDIQAALAALTDGVGSQCGLCNSLLGFLAAIDYPPLSENMFAWEVYKDHGESMVFQMLITPTNSSRDHHPASSRSKKIYGDFDSILLSYLGGFYKQDDTASLAYAYYVYSGMGKPNRMIDDGIRSGIARSPKNVGSMCLDAIPYVIEASRSAMRSRQIEFYEDGNEEYKSKKYAEFVKKLALMGDSDGLRVMGDFYYAGHDAGGISVNLQNALSYWRMAADRGDTASALTIANHYITNSSSDDSVTGEAGGNLRDAERYLRMVADSGSGTAASTARFYLARYGLGQPKDPVLAAKWLRESADRGDVNSQMLMGHAYAGIMPDVIPEEGKNIFLALEYYKRAARSGNIVAKFNSAVLTLHGYDLNYTSASDRCNASYKLFVQAGRVALIPAAVKVLSKWANQYNDEIGNVLTNMFLSEMGDPDANALVTKYFARQHSSNKLCYVSSPHTKEYTNVNNCYYFYARRSGYDGTDDSSLLLAEAMISGNPWNPKEALEWALKAKNSTKGKFLYATMLEAGLGMSQDCKGAWETYSGLLSSRERKEQLLGLLCIFRTRLMYLTSYVPWVYRLMAFMLYDSQIAQATIDANYKPCKFAFSTRRRTTITGSIVISAIFTAIVVFSTFAYLKIR